MKRMMMPLGSSPSPPPPLLKVCRLRRPSAGPHPARLPAAMVSGLHDLFDDSSDAKRELLQRLGLLQGGSLDNAQLRSLPGLLASARVHCLSKVRWAGALGGISMTGLIRNTESMPAVLQAERIPLGAQHIAPRCLPLHAPCHAACS